MQAYRDIRILTAIVTAFVILEAVNQPIVLLLAMLAPDFFEAHIMPIASTVDLANVVILFLTMFVFGYWIYCAGRNIADAGVEHLKFTPASRIWWHAVPFANLVMPFRGMRELFNASHGGDELEENHWLLTTWWTCWLINNVTANLANVAFREDQMSTTPLWIIAATGAPLAVFAIMLIRNIAEAQRRVGPEGLREVFA